MRDPQQRVAALFVILVMLPFATGCAPPDTESLAGIARAIAPELDTSNGLPTAVLDEYRCDPPTESCRERTRYVHASPMDATVITTAFAEARGIPTVRYEVTEFPSCVWDDRGAAPTGLWAEFVGPPSIQGDSARVELATVCMDRSGFEQVHEFLLHFDEGEWKVARRRLISIT
jgi:hypothetical protein